MDLRENFQTEQRKRNGHSGLRIFRNEDPLLFVYMETAFVCLIWQIKDNTAAEKGGKM